MGATNTRQICSKGNRNFMFWNLGKCLLQPLAALLVQAPQGTESDASTRYNEKLLRDSPHRIDDLRTAIGMRNKKDVSTRYYKQMLRNSPPD